MTRSIWTPSPTGERMIERYYYGTAPRPGDRLTPRDRWHAWFAGGNIDRVPDCEVAFWPETLARWRSEGLPESIATDEQAFEFFGLDAKWLVPVNVGIWPTFEAGVLSEDDRRTITMDYRGVKYETFKDGSGAIPHYLEFPVRDWDSWRSFKERLLPDALGRLPDPERWEKMTLDWANRDYPLGIHLGSTFGWVRNWMGFESATIACIDSPDLVHDIVETVCSLVCAVIEPVLREVRLDFGFFWEDISFKNGPMLSPAMFRDFQVPRYRRITDLCRKHGIECFIVDSDGDITQLIVPWLEAGINTMYPLEVAAGADPTAIRERFGPDLYLMGGVDKRALIHGCQATKQELLRLKPVVDGGRFIPHVDHSVPPDVSYECFLYYLEAKRDILCTGNGHGS